MGSSWNEEFFSHPGILLREHLQDVAEATVDALRTAHVGNPDLLTAARLMGLGHDFGKYSTFFQNYLKGTAVKTGLSGHSAVSALFTAWLTAKTLPAASQYLVPIAFSCVLRHHGHLKSPATILGKLGDERSAIDQQVRSIAANSGRVAAELAAVGVDGVTDFLREYPATLRDVDNRLLTMRYQLRSGKLDGWLAYFQTLLLFSALIDSDKKDAAEYRQFHRPSVPSDLVERFREARFRNVPESTINALRRAIYDDVMNQVDIILKQERPPRIMTLTAPTGSGKTLAGLAAALKLRDRIAGERRSPPRIIYALPYINIIDQTYDVFQRVTENAGLVPSLHLLLRHHHLALGNLAQAPGEQMPLHQQLLLQESWDAEVVVTTFVQLFETLVGYRNTFLKKLHNLYNAIIILDEIQALPIDYWFLVRNLFTRFTEEADSYVIFMTATQPLIFQRDQAYELVPKHADYFSQVHRTRLFYSPEAATKPDAAAAFALDQWDRAKARSLLVVVNTIGTSIQLYNTIRSRLCEDAHVVCLGSSGDGQLPRSLKDPVRLAYLSTNIVPTERQRRVRALGELLAQGRRVVAVTTQVVEAGVDLDFDLVVRDIGPIDAINQVAGRCNRSANRPEGQVHVVRMVDDRNTPYAQLVYQRRHVQIAEDLLQRYAPLPEAEFHLLLRDYLARVQAYEGEIPDVSRQLVDAIRTLQFDALAAFRLVDEKPAAQRVPVFLELDDAAKATRGEFLAALDRFEGAERSAFFEQRALLRRALTDVSGYVVEVRDRDMPPVERLAARYDMRYVKAEHSSEYYDLETGYRRKGVQPVIW